MSDSTLLLYWKTVLKKRAEAPFLKVAQSGAPPVLSYNHSAFYRRASRVAFAFKELLGVKPGSRIVVLLEEQNDVALITHGFALAGICCVLAPTHMSIKGLLGLIKVTKTEKVIFPTSYAAKVASILSQTVQVKEWIVTGKGARISGIKNLRHLDDLLVASTGDELREGDEADLDREVLMLPSEDRPGSFLSFTQKALLKAGQALQSIYPEARNGMMSWNMFPECTFHSILHSYFSPLFTNVPSLALPISDTRDFWRHLYANNVCFSVITNNDLEKIYRQGKPRDFRLSEDLLLAVCTKTYFSSQFYNSFKERFPVRIERFFSLETAGGVISATKEGDDEHESDFLSSGQILPDVECHVHADSTITIRTPRAFHAGAGNSAPKKNDDGGFVSGYSGEVRENTLWLEGRSEDLTTRSGKKINLARIEQALKNMRGISHAIALTVPGTVTDKEIAVHLFTHRLSNITQLDVELYLGEILEPYEMPFIYDFAEVDSKPPYPTRDEIAKRLSH